MPAPTGPTNPALRRLIRELRRAGREKKAPIWSDLADRLESPRRRRAEVNLSEINRYARDGETVVVPGKVLAAGKLSRSVTVAAFKFSAAAKRKIVTAGGRVVKLEDLIKEKPEGDGLRLMG